MRKVAVDDKMGVKKGPWTREEDLKLSTFIQENGHGSWGSLPSKAGLQRCGRSCRLRWHNYLRPDIKRGEFSLQEDQTIIQLHALLGNRWSAIASYLPRRTDNEIKNYWNTHLKKKLVKMGIDPFTHKPNNHTLRCGKAKDFANLCHMAQWESARLEAEARLVRVSEHSAFSNPNHHLLNSSAMAPPPPLQPPCPDILKVCVRTNPEIDISSTIFSGFVASGCAPDQSRNSTFSMGNHHDEVKGIMGNSMAESMNSVANYNGMPDFTDGFWNFLEDCNAHYWGAL